MIVWISMIHLFGWLAGFIIGTTVNALLWNAFVTRPERKAEEEYERDCERAVERALARLMEERNRGHQSRLLDEKDQ